MALTRITKGVIKPNENYDTHNINSTGIVTAIGLDINGNGDVSGNLSVGGVLTYEDVTSIDSVGIVTAQKGIHVGAGVSAVGVGTFSGLDISGDLDVDGHTNLDNVSIAGVTTTTGTIKSVGTSGRGAQLGGLSVGYDTLYATIQPFTGTSLHLNYNAGTDVKIGAANTKVDLDVNGDVYPKASGNRDLGLTGKRWRNVYGTTFIGNGDFVDIDVDGHTNLDNVSIAGVTTGTTINATTFVGALTGEASQVTIGSGANNRIITASGTNTLDCAGNFTFSGNVMELGAAGSEGGALYLHGGTINNPGGRDAKLWIEDPTSNDWAININKTGQNYGIQMSYSDSASHAFYILGGGGERFRITGSGEIAKCGSIYPRAADTFDIGDNGTSRWRNIYSEKLFADDLIRLGTPPWNEASGDFRTLSISGRTANSSGFIYLGNGVATTNADFDLGRIRIHNGATEVALITGTTDTSANDDGRIEFHTRNTGGSLQERLRIRSDGNIGIGNNVADANWKLKLVVPDNSSYQTAFNVTNNQNSDFNVVIKSNVTAIGNGTNNPLVFFTNGNSNERLRITSGGEVGIGTVPASGTTLDIDASGGGVLALRRNSVNTSNKITLSHDGTNGTLESTNNVLFRAGGDERLRIHSTGETSLLRINSFPNPNNTGSEILGSKLIFGSNIMLEERYPNGAYADRQDLVLRANRGYGLGQFDNIRFTAGGMVNIENKTITGGNNLAIQNFTVRGVWSGSPSIGKSIELISGYDSSVKMAAIGYNLTDVNTGSTYGGDLTFHTQPVYGSPTTPLPERMRISSSGYVTKSVVPCWNLRPSYNTTQTTANTSSHHAIGWGANGTANSNFLQNCSLHASGFTYNIHNGQNYGKLRVPVAGRYYVNVTYRVENNPQQGNIYVYVNNSQIARQHVEMWGHRPYMHCQYASVLNLAKNDEILIAISCPNANVSGHNDNVNWFSGYLIG